MSISRCVQRLVDLRAPVEVALSVNEAGVVLTMVLEGRQDESEAFLTDFALDVVDTGLINEAANIGADLAEEMIDNRNL